MKIVNALLLFAKRLFAEFGIEGSQFKPVNLTSYILRISGIACVLIVCYVLFRTLMLKVVLANDHIRAAITDVYHANWFEAILIIFLAATALTFLLRIIKPVRLSGKVMLICVIAYALYFVEQRWFSDFTFYQSRNWPIDYASIVILPVLLEGILRLTYILRRREKKNISVFLENQPIEKDDEDKTTRKLTTQLIADELRKVKFGKSYSIGIVGDWGVGKTSFIKNLKTKISREAIIIQFNPWLSTGKSSLLQEYIESLKEELSKHDKSISFELDRYFTSLSEIEKTTKTSFATVLRNLFNENHSSRTEFLNVRRSIDRIDKQIIIFVDDLDRLDKDEIIDVLKLIRNTGNFPNTVYISCYDKIFLLHALQSFNKRNLNILLDKFFDVEIPLAPIPTSTIIKLITDEFLIPNKIPKESYESAIALIDGHMFKQFREAKKFITSLKLNYSLYGKGLYFHDFLLLEVLKVKYPFLPEIMWAERQKFFKEEGVPAVHVLISANVTAEPLTTSRLEIESHLARFEQTESSKHFLTAADHTLICRVLNALFPGKPLGDIYAIQETNYFESYFFNNLPDSTLTISNWDTTILDGSYSTHHFFKEKHDLKKELLVFHSVFARDKAFKNTFSDKPEKIYKFLMFLIDWSDGTLSLKFLDKIYELKTTQTNKELFIQHLGEHLTPVSFYARTNLAAILLRKLVDIFGTSYASPKDLHEVNDKLFGRYIDGLATFNNETFSILYHQIERITDDSKVEITKQALDKLLEYVKKYDVEYLDLVLRNASTPNFDRQFVFEPITCPHMFGTKLELARFILDSKTYPESRKRILLAYLEKSFSNEYGSLQVNLEQAELEAMPYEFRNAWDGLPDKVKEDIVKTTETYEAVFTNQQPGTDPTLNDEVLNQTFEVLNREMEITLTPGKTTEYWRFGFKFSETKKFPDVKKGRHVKPYADVCITAGVFVSGNPKKWFSNNHLSMANHFIEPQGNHFIESLDYAGQPVSLKVQFTTGEKSNTMDIEVLLDGKSLGNRIYNLQHHRYFTLSAWCDEREFELTAKIITRTALRQPVLEKT